MSSLRNKPPALSEHARQNLIAGVLLAVFVTAIVLSLTTLATRAMMVPLPIAILSAIFAIIQLVLQNRKKSQRRKPHDHAAVERAGAAVDDQPASGGDGTDARNAADELLTGSRGRPVEDGSTGNDAAVGAAGATPTNGRPEIAGPTRQAASKGGSPWMAVLLISIYLALIFVIGLLLATALYVAGYLKYVARLSAPVSILTSVLTVGGLYLLFVVTLGVRLWGGYLGIPLL